MAMSQKHYEGIGRVLFNLRLSRKIDRPTLDAVIEGLADYMESDNKTFDRERFIKHCLTLVITGQQQMAYERLKSHNKDILVDLARVDRNLKAKRARARKARAAKKAEMEAGAALAAAIEESAQAKAVAAAPKVKRVRNGRKAKVAAESAA